MYLAKNQFGQIGRVTRQDGMTAIIAPAPPADARGNLFVSAGSIAEDEASARQAEGAKRAKLAASRAARIAQEKYNQQEYLAGQARARQEQLGARRAQDVLNEKLKRHFMGQANSTENDRVASTVRADFTQTEEIRSGGVMRPINRRADFDMMQLVGNPLTRNGCYGPSTDWDYILKGDELENARVVGGTMLGRYNGQQKQYTPPGLGRHGRVLPYKRNMGDDFEDFYNAPDDADLEIQSYETALSEPAPDQTYTDEVPTEDVTADYSAIADAATAPPVEESFWDKFWSSTEHNIISQAPATLTNALVSAAVPKASAGTVSYPAPGSAVAQPYVMPASAAVLPTPVKMLAQKMGVNPWLLVGGVGLLGVGLVVTIARARK